MTEPSIIVQKYGGSSVADIPKLKRVAEHIATTTRHGFRVVVVVSAMGKTTDDLIRMAQSMSQAPSRRELDMLLSTGERISMSLLAMALAEQGVDAISFTGSQSGILTNDRHSGARIIEVRPIRIEDELMRNKVVIVAGFQGMSYKREITTLGRGGSDTTAVALAAALGATACEIYSDVDGVYSADPRVVQNAKHIKEISYEEMQELSEHGAKVLNAQAVEWAKRAGIVIHARKTGYQDGDPETKIVSQTEKREGTKGLAMAVTGSKHEIMLTSSTQGAEILSFLAREGVPLRQSKLLVEKQGTHLDALFVRDDIPDLNRLVSQLLSYYPSVKLNQHTGSVTAVGAGLGTQSSCMTSVIDTLTKHHLPFREVTTGPFRISVGMNPEDVERGTQLVHELLISN